MPQFFKTPYREITATINAALGLPSAQNTVLLIGKRTAFNGNSLLPLAPLAGYPTIPFYKAYGFSQAFSSGAAALSFMQGCGFSVGYGISGRVSLPAPNSVVVNPDTTVTLTYSSAPIDWNYISGAQVVATFTQASSKASGQSASYASNSYSVTLKNVTGSFDTTDIITVSYIDYSQNVPDPNRTEDICMTVWSFYEQLNSNPATMNNTTMPLVYMAVLADRDTGFNPNAEPIALVQPDNVVTLANGNVQLFWNSVPANYVYIPAQGLGDSVISQNTKVSGVVVQTLSGAYGPSGSAVGVELSNVQGTFDNTDALSLVLDATQDVFTLFGNQGTGISYVQCPYEISTSQDVNVTYKLFFDYVNASNQPLAVNNNHFTCFGVVGNMSMPLMQYSNLPTFNSQYICPVYFPNNPAIGDIANTMGMLTASALCAYAMNDVPFNPLNNTSLAGIFASSTMTDNIVNSPLGTSEAVLDLGWTPIAINTNNQPYVIRAITSLLTVPGTTIPDVEFFPLTVWQIVALWKKTVYQFSNQPQFVNVRKSPYVKSQLLSGVQSLALQFESLGMFLNMKQYIPLFTVTDDITDPSKYDINTPILIAPELNAIQINVSIQSVFNAANTGLNA